ncbi:MAG: protein of unknown function DUF1905 [Parcubacteria group bacterium Athens0416_74]|nr:MAG: protein of unknown function DUF1905 [Parcubacteria group bacterium Athens0416_74]
MWPGEGAAWHFVHVDKKTSEILKENHGKAKRGFGSIPIEAQIGKTKWKTSVFPDKRSGTYLLPLKAMVRRAEQIDAEDTIAFRLSVLT